MDRQLRDVWDALRAQNQQRSESLRSVRIRELRGIDDLTVAFPYPVSVLAGPNGCGKSTILFACACAYQDPDPERKPRRLTPGIVFPDFIDKNDQSACDMSTETELEFDYLHKKSARGMTYRRGGRWNRSYGGRKKGQQPQRRFYLRTLANLTNPAEVRSFLQLARQQTQIQRLPTSSLSFAQGILLQDYQYLKIIKAKNRDLLFVDLRNQTPTQITPKYSEFHMSSGERAILHLSKDLSEFEESFILIDEIEAGLHPYAQQQVMLELQRMALRQKLQVIVTSHSPVVLDSVPLEGRIFLDRDIETNKVQVMPNYRDIFQKALYGQSLNKLSILCEDKIAEAIVRGVLDEIIPDLDLYPGDFIIDRDTGISEFPGHVRTLGKFSRLGNFLMVLDGDATTEQINTIKRSAKQYPDSMELLTLPDSVAPEQWIWNVLKNHANDYAGDLGIDARNLKRSMANIENRYRQGLDHRQIPKDTLQHLAQDLSKEPESLARLCGRLEAKFKRGDMAEFRNRLLEQIELWRIRSQ